MTKTETPECYFCQGPAAALKKEATLIETERADGTVIEGWMTELLPICEDCHEDNYDGTERYPALLPLA